MTLAPGIHPGIPAEDYHADPCDKPSLSASIAHVLTAASPLHAWTAHPRLNPLYTREEKKHYDTGSAAHSWLLEGSDIVVPVEAPDWRTKDAKQARDDARVAGKVPLLSKDHAKVVAMVSAVHEQLANHHADPPLFTDGKPEQTLVWEEPGGVVCRARVDWLRDDRHAVDDLKTTSRSASPEAYARRLFDQGVDVQAEFYCRGVERLTGVRPEFRLVVVETGPPYAVGVVSLAPSAVELARRKVDHAIGRWAECLAADSWPGYWPEVAYAEAPSWEQARWLDREALDEFTREAA